MAVFAIAKRDTFINLMSNMDYETAIPKGTRMFQVTSENHTRYLESDEICLYTPELGTNYSYVGDWELQDN